MSPSKTDDPSISEPAHELETETLGTEDTRVQRFSLEVLAGPEPGLTTISKGDKITVGSHKANDLCLPEKSLSRFHCEIYIEDNRVLIRDLGSRNGTKIDGISVLRAYLRDGASLTLGRVRLRYALQKETNDIPLSEKQSFGGAVGQSTAMRALFHKLERIATTDGTVLLQGETGTGKDLLAESIHQESTRRDKPFVVVDCGTLPRDLLASELFGHEKGAFTGADRDRPGAVESAEGGTLFLDELGELAIDLQPSLLRLLESKEFQRVGSTDRRHADVRIIAATNRDLKRAVNERSFRSDLYYRVAVLEVRVPPLRERRDDLPVLVSRLLEDIGDPGGQGHDLLLGQEGLNQLERHRWDGNVRELRNYVERSLALRATAPFDQRVEAEPTLEPDLSLPFSEARERWSRAFERAYLKAMLDRNGGNVSATAREAGLDRVYLHRLLKRSGLR